jgi:iron(III) transport system substrate-binding protein
MHDFGWQYYEQLKANNAVVLRSNGDVARALASGEVVIAQIVDFFVRRLKADGSPVDHIWPKEGALLVPTPIGIIKGTANQAAAEAFVNYLYTPEAQRIFVSLAYIPVIPGLPYPAHTPDLADFRPLLPNLEYIEKNRELIRRRFGELFGGSQ